MRKRDIVVQIIGGRDPDWRIEVPYLPPSQPNQIHAGTNVHAMRAVRAKHKRQAIQDVYALLVEQGWTIGPPTIRRAEVAVTFILPTNAKRDHDNLVAGCKPLFDALHPERNRDPERDRPTGLLIDDNLGVIGIPWYDYEVRPGVSATLIEIWDTTQTTRMEGL